MADKSGSEFVEDATETVHDSNVVAKPTYKVGADVDDALQLALTDTEVSWSEEEERKVLFLGTLIGYADGQAFGFSALFGLVQDLKLFTVSLVNGQPVVDESKYQLAAGIVSLGGAAVRRTESNSIYQMLI
ncbi:hypothetical protein EIK77_000077 [Talaromyces pinophilus]|nr:hypothetical protein EIK77_000077 [Talaromyces pinophilus]